MAPLREVELITIGDELLLGFTIDTNGAFLAQRLAAEGIGVARRTAVGDDVQQIASAVREALARTSAVITTGGLGPTSDDVSRDAVAQVFARPLRVDEAHLAWMRERWRKRFGRDMPEANRRQAMIPEGARKLDNNFGSAPGILIEDEHAGWGGRFVVMLPGVPRELRGMTDDTLLPLLRERGLAGTGAVIRSRTLRTTGVAESLLADRLTGLELTASGASLAYLPGVDGVDLRITARAPDARTADAVIATMAAAVRAAVGDAIYGEDSQDLAAVLLDLCRQRKLSIAVAESCTGGLLGARLTTIPGSSDVFVGGVIAYADAVKVRDLDVPQSLIDTEGAVSEAVVRAMARGARKRLGTALALSITGVAGPSGGTAEKPVGLVWICAALAERVEARRLQLWGDRQEIRYRSAQAAMELGRRLLL